MLLRLAHRLPNQVHYGTPRVSSRRTLSRLLGPLGVDHAATAAASGLVPSSRHYASQRQRASHQDRVFAIRREDNTVWERRAPLAPSHVRELVKKGIKVILQPSNRRAFSMTVSAFHTQCWGKERVGTRRSKFRVLCSIGDAIDVGIVLIRT